MFTVIIAEEEHIKAIREKNRLFFEPFLKQKDLVFCAWNTEGQSFKEAVPGLVNAVGRKREWRAIIVAPRGGEDYQNPFDLVDPEPIFAIPKPAVEPGGVKENAEELSVSEWYASWVTYYEKYWEEKKRLYEEALTKPLTRLSTMLCFKPADFNLYEVRHKEDVDDWAMAQLNEGDKPSVLLETLENEEYHRELSYKEVVRREFFSDFLSGARSIGIVQPLEVLCLSQRTTENGYFDPTRFWEQHDFQEYSEFADRNMFFDRMRFLTCDVLPEKHVSHRVDQIRFLYNLMTIAANDIPDSALQARRLYVIDSKNDEKPLCELVLSYDKKLSATYDAIGEEIEKIKGEIPGELSDLMAEELFCARINVPVTVDKEIGEDGLLAPLDGYGFSSNCPEEEFQRWNGDRNTSLKTLDRLVKQPRRAVKKAIEKLDAMSEVSDAQAGRLNSFQMDDVREFTEKEEDAMISMHVEDIYDVSRYYEQLEEKDKEVHKVIGRRMSKGATVVLSAIVLGLFFICFLPMVLTNRGNGESISTAFIVVSIFLLAMGAILFICLLFLRMPLKKAVKSFNETMEGIRLEIREILNKFSNYLSSVCNIRRGYSVLSYSEKNIDQYTLDIRLRKKHQSDIKMLRAVLEEDYKDFITDEYKPDPELSKPYNYDFGRRKEYEYPAPYPAATERQVEFLERGNFATVPTSFVKQIQLRMEELYDE